MSQLVVDGTLPEDNIVVPFLSVEWLFTPFPGHHHLLLLSVHMVECVLFYLFYSWTRQQRIGLVGMASVLKRL
jgi:hypothetical protein